MCPSSRPSAQVFCLPFWIKEAFEGNPNYLRNKLLFEFMRKLFLCSLVVGVTLSTSLPPRMTILVPSNSRLLTDLFMGCVGELTSLWLLRACLSLAAALRDSVGFILFLFLDKIGQNFSSRGRNLCSI